VELLDAFLSWAWARNHNLLSWYIRPLFLLPFCYFAYKRSIKGIALTLLALATSMFWFPEPEQPDPKVLEFLAAEKEYLTGNWTLWEVLMSLLVPASLAALALALWRRSLFCGLAVINAMMLTKSAWSFYYGGDSGRALLPPALVGVVVCSAVILYVAHRIRGTARS
jgi:hypothetical protein